MKRSCLWILTLALGAAAPAVEADKKPPPTHQARTTGTASITGKRSSPRPGTY